MRVPQTCFAAVAAAVLVMTAGCAATPAGRDAAGDVSIRLLGAVRDGDAAAACALLAPQTAAAVQQSAGKPCRDAIGEQHLPAPGTVTSVDIDGQWARWAS